MCPLAWVRVRVCIFVYVCKCVYTYTQNARSKLATKGDMLVLDAEVVDMREQLKEFERQLKMSRDSYVL